MNDAADFLTDRGQPGEIITACDQLANAFVQGVQRTLRLRVLWRLLLGPRAFQRQRVINGSHHRHILAAILAVGNHIGEV